MIELEAARIDAARLLMSHLRHTLEALAAGRVSPAHVAVIADGARLLTAAIDDAIEDARRALTVDSDSRDDIADRGPTGVAQVKRPGGVGRNELHIDVSLSQAVPGAKLTTVEHDLSG